MPSQALRAESRPYFVVTIPRRGKNSRILATTLVAGLRHACLATRHVRLERQGQEAEVAQIRRQFRQRFGQVDSPPASIRPPIRRRVVRIKHVMPKGPSAFVPGSSDGSAPPAPGPSATNKTAPAAGWRQEKNF